MAEYSLEVTTGSMMHVGTFDNVYVTLIGTERESERTYLTSLGLDNKTGKVGMYSVTLLLSLGCLLLLKLERDPFHESPKKDWFCSKIVVRTPEGDEILFPCHTWLSRGESVLLRGGRATKAFEDFHPQLVDQRKKELVKQKLMFKWEKYEEGIPYAVNINDLNAAPADIRYSFSKASQFENIHAKSLAELHMKGLLNSTEPWKSFKAMKEFSWFKKPSLSQYVVKHWKDDDFFGSQFLNGFNPFVVQRCSRLPANFAVTEEMVKPFLSNGSSLTGEMEFDLPGWIPNGPMMLNQAPSTTKGQSSMYTILATLPTKSRGGHAMAVVWLLSSKFEDFVPLGTYPEQRFDEPAALQMIEDFQAELSFLSVAITRRNSALELPYNYMNPRKIENSCDYHSWLHNGSVLLRKPPPTSKGQSNMQTILETIPNVGQTVSTAAMLWILSHKYTDEVPLGTFPDEQFDEHAPQQAIKEISSTVDPTQ